MAQPLALHLFHVIDRPTAQPKSAPRVAANDDFRVALRSARQTTQRPVRGREPSSAPADAKDVRAEKTARDENTPQSTIPDEAASTPRAEPPAATAEATPTGDAEPSANAEEAPTSDGNEATPSIAQPIIAAIATPLPLPNDATDTAKANAATEDATANVAPVRVEAATRPIAHDVRPAATGDAETTAAVEESVPRVAAKPVRIERDAPPIHGQAEAVPQQNGSTSPDDVQLVVHIDGVNADETADEIPQTAATDDEAPEQPAESSDAAPLREARPHAPSHSAGEYAARQIAAHRQDPRLARLTAPSRDDGSAAKVEHGARQDAVASGGTPSNAWAIHATIRAESPGARSLDAARPAPPRVRTDVSDALPSVPAATASAVLTQPHAGTTNVAARLDASQAARATNVLIDVAPVTIDRLTDVVASHVAENRWHVSLQLDPPELGRLRLDVSMREDGLAVRMHVGSESVRRLAESRLPDLVQALSDQEMRVAHTQVTVREPGQGGLNHQAPQRDADPQGQQPHHHGNDRSGQQTGDGRAGSEGHAGHNDFAPAQAPSARMTDAGLRNLDLVA